MPQHICLNARVTRHTGPLVFWVLLCFVAPSFRSTLLLLALLLLLLLPAAAAAAAAFPSVPFSTAKSAITLPFLKWWLWVRIFPQSLYQIFALGRGMHFIFAE